jgi:uncharacterized protein YgiB involved in biofilm formation
MHDILKMKRSQRISLYLISSAVLVSCDDKPSSTYQDVKSCSNTLPESVCHSAYAKAKKKDESKSAKPLDECNRLYYRCEPWKSGYAPIMQGFTVHLPDNGEPYYEKKSTSRRRGHIWNDWGSKLRFGGFGNHGSGFGG